VQHTLIVPALVAVMVVAAGFPDSSVVRVQAAAPTFPIRAAFYYSWFPGSWTQQGIYPYTYYTPVPDGYYDSGSLAVIDDHIDRMKYAGIQVGISSWWGQTHITNTHFPLLLQEARSRDFYWTLYYEPVLDATNTASDLTYIYATYASDPNFLKIGGKPVLFIYTRAVKTCADVAEWETLNAGRFYLDPQVFAGYRTCAVQPESWHQYAPTSAQDSQKGYSFTISPGFWLRTDSAPRLVRDPVRWRTNIQAMIASGAPWQLITTFNEWGEGTAVEDATQWQSCGGYGIYLDALHANGLTTVRAACQASPQPEPARTPAAQSTTPSPVPSPAPRIAGIASNGSASQTVISIPDSASILVTLAAEPFRVLPH
jgi:Glycosyl hydrolase family 99